MYDAPQENWNEPCLDELLFHDTEWMKQGDSLYLNILNVPPELRLGCAMLEATDVGYFHYFVIQGKKYLERQPCKEYTRAVTRLLNHIIEAHIKGL